MKPAEFFHHCPRCGQRVSPPADCFFQCGACGFRLYFNPTVAVAVFIERADGRVLLIRRAKDPGRGRWAPPGGFIDMGETAEVAAVREVREEVGLELRELSFICSQPNQYPFAEVTYPVLDLFFRATADDGDAQGASEEVTSLGWVDPNSVSAEELAFPSMQQAWRVWRNGNWGAADRGPL